MTTSRNRCRRYTDDQLHQDHAYKMGVTYAQFTSELLSPRDDTKPIFSKDMAQYIVKLSIEKGKDNEFVVLLEKLRKNELYFLDPFRNWLVRHTIVVALEMRGKRQIFRITIRMKLGTADYVRYSIRWFERPECSCGD